MAYTTVAAPAAGERRVMTLPRLAAMHAAGEKIAMLTCYDASFAALLDRAGIDVILIGDSLGMVVQGLASTLPVTLADVAYHTACVVRGAHHPLIIADMPFATYHANREDALRNAAKLMQAGAQVVKLEGGEWLADTVQFLTARGIAVCGHLGYTPQSVHALGGPRVQGKSEESARQLVADARALSDAGARLLVLEMVPAPAAAEVTAAISIPTIGIGAGAQCAGQVLVLYDILGLYPGRIPRFVRNFLDGNTSVEAALAAYVAAVKDGSFPAAEHSFPAP